MKMRSSIGVCVLAAAAAFTAQARSAPAVQNLVARNLDVNQVPTFRTVSGRLVTRVKRGTYRIIVHDRSADANFRLFGPGIDKRTTFEFRGTTTWTIKFNRGVYRYRVTLRHTSLHQPRRVQTRSFTVS